MIKISASEFYREVTGVGTSNSGTTQAALKRWGIPFPENYHPRTRVFDASLVPHARELYEQEEAVRAQNREGRESNGNRHEAHMVFIREALVAQNAALGRIESVANKLLAEWTGMKDPRLIRELDAIDKRAHR